MSKDLKPGISKGLEEYINNDIISILLDERQDWLTKQFLKIQQSIDEFKTEPSEVKEILFLAFTRSIEIINEKEDEIKFAANFIHLLALLSIKPGFAFEQDDEFNLTLAKAVSNSKDLKDLKRAVNGKECGLQIDFTQINPSIKSSASSSRYGSSTFLNFLGLSPGAERRKLSVPTAKSETLSEDKEKTKNRDNLHCLLNAYSHYSILKFRGTDLEQKNCCFRTINFARAGDTLYSFAHDEKRMTLLVDNIAETLPTPARQFTYELKRLSHYSTPEATLSDEETGEILQTLLVELLGNIVGNKADKGPILIKPKKEDLLPNITIIVDKDVRTGLLVMSPQSKEATPAKLSPPTVALVIQALQNLTGEKMMFPTMGTSEEVSRSAPGTPETQRKDFTKELESALGSPRPSPSSTGKAAPLTPPQTKSSTKTP